MISQAETATAKKPEKETLVSLMESAKKDYSRYIETKKILENPSRVLKNTKEGSRLGLKLFEEMEGDDQIGSDLDIRRLKVSSFPFQIIVEDGTDSDAEQAKELKKQITPIYRELVKEVQDALVYGYSLTELFWEIYNGRVELPKVQGHDQGQFTFTADGEILWETEGGNTVPVHPHRVITATFGKRKGNLFGRSLIARCFWPWFFKKHGWLFWSTYLEKFGQPTVVGKYPPNTRKEQRQELLRACQAIQNDMAVVVDQTWMIELMEAKRNGTVDSYEKFIHYCNRCISKVILMTTLTSNEVNYGTMGQALVHKDLSDECIEDDALWLADVLTKQLVKLLAMWNYNFTAQPKLVIQYATEDTSKEEAEKDGLLSERIAIPTSYLHNKYNIPVAADDDEVTFRGILCLKKDLPKYIQGQVGANNNSPQKGNVNQHQKDKQEEAEFSADDIDDSERFILEENEYIESVYTTNLQNLKKSYDLGQLETLLDQADDFPSAILKLNNFKSAKLAQGWEPHLTLARLLAEYSVQKQMEAQAAANAEFAASTIDEEDFRKLEAKEAVRWFRGRVSMTRQGWRMLDDEVKQSAFFVSQVEDLNLINYVKEKMIKALLEGVPYKQFKKELFLESGVEPFFGHMYTAYHTNMYSALAAQNEAALLRNTDQFKWWRYSAVLDGRTRPHHAAMHGIVARYDDPFWQMWSPPNGYNCRCRKVIAFNWQVEAGNRKKRQMGYLNFKPDPGWEFAPNEGLFKNYRKLLKDKNTLTMRLNQKIREAV